MVLLEMDYERLVHQVQLSIYGSAVLVFLILLIIPAPYGKFYRDGWGWKLDGKMAWFLFESVPMFSILVTFSAFSDTYKPSSLQWLLLTLWQGHYFHRSVIYTIRAPRMAPQSFATAFLAAVFNVANGFVNGYSLTKKKDLSIPWTSASFSMGLLLFFLGMYINITSDSILFALRRSRGTASSTSQGDKSVKSTLKTRPESPSSHYFIPHGHLFDYVSCPHYFGEIIEWIGWAILCWNASALAFAIFTAANLIPRALSSHQWYKKTFKDKYPASRKAVIPFLV